jgi:hypothetical protein
MKIIQTHYILFIQFNLHDNSGRGLYNKYIYMLKDLKTIHIICYIAKNGQNI